MIALKDFLASYEQEIIGTKPRPVSHALVTEHTSTIEKFSDTITFLHATHVNHVFHAIVERNRQHELSLPDCLEHLLESLLQTVRGVGLDRGCCQAACGWRWHCSRKC